MATDKSGLDSTVASARGVIAITPADSDLAVYVKAIYVGTQGDVKVTAVDGTTATLVAALGVVPVACKRIWATGTGASNIVGLV